MRTSLRALTALALGVPLVVASVSPSAAAPSKRKSTADTTAPAVFVAAPTSGSASGDAFTASGSASDNKSLSGVYLALDGAAFQPAIGTTSWSLPFSGVAAGTHTLTAKAVDAAGNAATSSVSFSVTTTSSTTTTSPSPAPAPTTSPSPTSSPSPSPSPSATSTSTSSTSTTSAPNTQGSWTSPEGMVINVNTAGSWTIAKIYQLMRDASAGPGDFARIAPSIDVQVQDTYASETATSAVGGSGSYSYYHATIYLKGVNSGFVTSPEATSTHEYGHAWNLFHLYRDHGGDWSPYLTTRWSTSDGSVTLAQDSRLNSSYAWDPNEIMADDYRLLFGTSLAVSQWPNHLNTAIVDPRNQAGLRTWFATTWL